ncbi:unnamed protein product [Ophioblennius macclurei]
MKVTFGKLVITAGICGLLSFAFLATSIGTDYWYIIEINAINTTDFENMSSHSGLWSINEGEKSSGFMDSFTADYSRYSESEQRMLNMHSAIVVVLPLSLVLVLLGGICGLVSSLAQSPLLLTGAASYFFICSVLTVCGTTLYVVYSQQAERLVGQENLAYVHTSFGWSFALAWLSYGLELLTGLLLLVAAQMIKRRHSRPTRA